MARLVKSVEGQHITCNVTTIFSSGATSTKILTDDDFIEGLRYVQDEEVKVISGRISIVNTICNRVTVVNVDNPYDYFSQDVRLTTVDIDISEPYHSNVVPVPAMEIVEDEGVEDVIKVVATPVPHVTFEMTYTDGSTIHQDVCVGDVLSDFVAKTSPGNPDITGDFKVVAFLYTIKKGSPFLYGLYLVPLSGGNAIPVAFDNIISFNERPSTNIDDPTSLAGIATALADSDEVYAFLDTDVTIPPREDGRITTLMINAGKSLTVDLSGHNIDTQAYAFYVNGGNLTVRDTSGKGRITASIPDKAYPVIQVNAGGVCNMEGGIIDTSATATTEGHVNWLYGVVCSGDGVFNMTGGQIITQDAAGISITNGTATGTGAKFNISGNAKIKSNDCTAIYLADNKEVNISGNAVIDGGILMRMGDLNLSGDSVVNSVPVGTEIYPLGKLVCESGCENHNAAILLMTGCYGSSIGNDLNVNVTEFAAVNGKIDNAIDIATLNTKYNQTVTISARSANLTYKDKLYNIYNHTQLAAMATAQGKTLGPELTTTDLTVKLNGRVVYPAS